MDDELRQLCEQASQAQDPEQVLDLVNQIIDRVDKKREPAPESPTASVAGPAGLME